MFVWTIRHPSSSPTSSSSPPPLTFSYLSGPKWYKFVIFLNPCIWEQGALWKRSCWVEGKRTKATRCLSMSSPSSLLATQRNFSKASGWSGRRSWTWNWTCWWVRLKVLIPPQRWHFFSRGTEQLKGGKSEIEFGAEVENEGENYGKDRRRVFGSWKITCSGKMKIRTSLSRRLSLLIWLSALFYWLCHAYLGNSTDSHRVGKFFWESVWAIYTSIEAYVCNIHERGPWGFSSAGRTINKLNNGMDMHALHESTRPKLLIILHFKFLTFSILFHEPVL